MTHAAYISQIRTHTHTLSHAHSHTPNTCTNAEKRASGRPTNRLMASVRKAIHTTRNWSENKTKNKKAWENIYSKTITKQVSASKQETTINKPPKYYIPYSRSVASKFSLKFRAEWEFLSSLPRWKSATLYDPLSQVSCADGSPLCSYKSALYIYTYILYILNSDRLHYFPISGECIILFVHVFTAADKFTSCFLCLYAPPPPLPHSIWPTFCVYSPCVCV